MKNIKIELRNDSKFILQLYVIENELDVLMFAHLFLLFQLLYFR
jgi:hypothetical protein